MNLMMHEVVHQEQLLMLVFHRLSIEGKEEKIENGVLIDRTLSNFVCSLSINWEWVAAFL